MFTDLIHLYSSVTRHSEVAGSPVSRLTVVGRQLDADLLPEADDDCDARSPCFIPRPRRTPPARDARTDRGGPHVAVGLGPPPRGRGGFRPARAPARGRPGFWRAGGGGKTRGGPPPYVTEARREARRA